MAVDILHDRRIRGFWDTFQMNPVHDEWAVELHNYFILGYQPGSFHTALFANDLSQASFKSHVSNKWENIRAFMMWVYANAPEGSWGSYDKVANWLKLSDEDRKKICINKGWMLTDEEYTWAKISEEA